MRIAALAPIIVALALTAAALTPAAAQSGQTITVYNAQHVTLSQAWADAFTKETGIRVTLRQGSDTELGNQLVQEGAASPADVFITENSPAMALVDAAGMFAPLSEATLSLVPPEYRPADGRWIGVAARSTVFAYNKNKLTPDKLPKSMLDLADPSWKGRWGASPSGADFQAIVGALLQLKGEAVTSAWLKAEKTNSVTYRGNTAVLRGVNLGEIEGGIIYHYYFFGDQAKSGENSNNVALYYFRNGDPGAFVSLSGAGVLATSKRKDAAEAFVRWIAGKGGQTILRDGDSYEYAVGVGATANPKLEPLAQLGAPKIEPSALDAKKVTALMTAANLL
jgi:iron(III) transport system substrate-binding protein